MREAGAGSCGGRHGEFPAKLNTEEWDHLVKLLAAKLDSPGYRPGPTFGRSPQTLHTTLWHVGIIFLYTAQKCGFDLPRLPRHLLIGLKKELNDQ